MTFPASIRASRPEVGSRPATFTTNRVCETEGCRTVISKYNKGPLCYTHSPPRKFRVRGVLPSEQMEKENQSAICIRCLIGNRGGAPFVLEGIMHISGENGNATICEV